MDNEKEIPFGAFDSELMHQEIYIPEGFEATINGDKIILKKIESEDEKIRKFLIEACKQSLIVGGFHKDKVIAWLEKQGEQKPVYPLAHEKMETERWKEACKAACSDRNYRSHYGLTETRDDYFVDGVRWADEHPK